MKPKTIHRDRGAFTRADLLALCAALFIFALIVLPALGRTHSNNSLIQSINNLRQLMNAWSMYPAQNGGRLVYSYPNFGGNQNTWCKGNADSTGTAGSYSYGGADPAGIEGGDLWPYVRSLSPYRCPSDNRLASQASGALKNQLILRSYSVNSYMAGETYPGLATITSPSTWDSDTYRLFVKESQLSKPSGLYVLIEEDGASINDSMFIMDMGGARKFLDLPVRHHSNSYPLAFADGHVETYRLQEANSLNWAPGQPGGTRDWAALTNVTTVPSR